VNAAPLLKLEGITKSYSGVRVLEDVSLEVRAGEVHALLGENGAGKTTLMNIVSGNTRADRGRMYWLGEPVAPRDPREGRRLGIGYVHQEPALVAPLSAAENIFLGRQPARRVLLDWVRWGEIHDRAGALLRQLSCPVDPARPIEQLSLAERQMVEIARALAFEARLLILDEPTAPLSEREAARLFEILAQLKGHGVSIIYISHRLKEVYQCADRVTVLRDGRRIVTKPVAETDPDSLVRWMAGREVRVAAATAAGGPAAAEALRVESFTLPDKFSEVSFAVHGAEIVALAGLAGAGRTELVEAIFGAAEGARGCVYLGGRPVRITSPVEAVRHGLALVPDDRKGKGLVPAASVRFNLALAGQRRFARLGWFIDEARETRRADELVRDLRVKTPGCEEPVMYLSGGNQQKIVLARWLFAGAKVFFFDEPTRGVDVASKAEIHGIIRRLAEGGAAVVLVSSELEEVMALAGRILVMHRGRLAGELRREEVSEERIMLLATGGATA